jgi:outer membrane receptor for Fe3+-dicitrate
MKRIILLTLLIISCFSAKSNNKFTTLKGVIKDNIAEMPIVGVKITTNFKQNTIYTDDSGLFSLGEIPIGTKVKLLLEKEGFASKEVEVLLKKQALQVLEFRLAINGFDLPDVIVASDNGVSVAASKILNAVDFELRPRNSAQDMLKAVPGLFIAQHAGGGKAEQIFLRGFDCDHGTDVAASVDDIPINMPSHGHGQGYLDLHFLVPEAVKNVSIQKGPYAAEHGDFSTAGAIAFKTLDKLEKNVAQIEVLSTPTNRLLMGSRALLMYQMPLQSARINSYVIGDYTRSAGYFESPQQFIRHNVMSKTTYQIAQNKQVALLLSNFGSSWNASGQVPERAIAAGLITRFGSIDNSEGGFTGRKNASLTYSQLTENQQFEIQAFYSKYDFRLFSNFTFFLNNRENGDEIEQLDNRQVIGVNTKYAFGKNNHFVTIGANVRADAIENQLSNAVLRVRTNDLAKAKIYQQSVGVYVKDDIRLSSKWSAEIGLRANAFAFSVSDKIPSDSSRANYSGQNFQIGLLPKVNLKYRLSNRYQLFFNLGKGFHSNDARSVVQDKNNHQLPAAWGTELGVSLRPLPNFWITTAFWALALDNELVFVGDEGTTENNGASRRFGIDVSARWKLNAQFYVDADVNLSNSILVENTFGKRLAEDYRIPLAPKSTFTGGVAYRTAFGLEGSLRCRHLSARAANESNTVIAKGYTLLDLNVNYTFQQHKWMLGIENVLNRVWNEAQFDTESFLPKLDQAPVSELHFTPGTPLAIKLTYARSF